MDLVTAILGPLAELGGKVKQTDALVLTAEERSSPHFARTTEQGRTVRLSLPRGAELNDGDVLAIDDGTAIVVRAAPEDLLSVTPRGAPIDWAIVGYQLGNLHRPVRFLEDRLLTPVDAMAEELLKRLGVAYARVRAPFIGRRYGSMTGHHHGGHGHDHGDHDRDHGPHHEHGPAHPHSHR
jgi:urease accessory protein